MRSPTKIKPWLCNSELKKWVKKAPSIKAYKRRLAVLMCQMERMQNTQISKILGTSTQTIWNWLSKYNKVGPEEYDFKPRGGRRNAILTPKQEKMVFAKFSKLYSSGQIDSVSDFLPELQKLTCHKVSLIYAYKLFNRLGWGHKKSCK